MAAWGKGWDASTKKNKKEKLDAKISFGFLLSLGAGKAGGVEGGGMGKMWVCQNPGVPGEDASGQGWGCFRW